MKKGITLTSLVIVIVIMSILASTVVYFSIDSLKVEEKSRFGIEILNIQNEVDKYFYEYGVYPVDGEVTFNLSNVKDVDLYQFDGEVKENNVIKFGIINLDLIGINKTDFGKNGSKGVLKNASSSNIDVYAVSETTGRVYYLKGVVFEDNTFYTLDSKLYAGENIQNGNITENDIQEGDVIFSVSDTEYTNKPITVTIKLPLDATITSISVTNNKSIGSEVQSGKYKTIAINETSPDKNGNYIISLTYTYNGKSKTVRYDVENFDNTQPYLTYSETNMGEYISVYFSCSDNTSGVKEVKYETANITDTTYFSKYGKNITGNTIYIKKGLSYTIFAQDNAGNINLINVNK